MRRALLRMRTAFVGLMLVSGFSGGALAETTLEKIKAQGSIRMGFTNEAPFAYATPDGQLTGVVIDVLHQIFDKMGVREFDGGLTTFGGLIPGLKAKRFDLVTSSIY